MSLVIGIVIGFAGGYSAGAKHSAAAPATQAFSEATVIEPPPAPVDPQPIVVESEPAVESEPEVRPNRPNVSNVSNPSNLSNGSIEVLSRPAGAQVILDGRVAGRTPLSVPNVATGRHTVRLQLPTYNRWETAIDVNGGARTRVAASLEQP